MFGAFNFSAGRPRYSATASPRARAWLMPASRRARTRLESAPRLRLPQFGERLKQFYVLRLAAEREYIAMKPRQHAHAAAGEEIRRAHGEGRGQLEHGVRAA